MRHVTLNYSNIAIEGEYSEVSLSNVRMVERINEHGRLFLTGTVPDGTRDIYVRNSRRFNEIRLVYLSGDEPDRENVIFSGFVEQVTVNRIHDVYVVELACVSRTFLLDVAVRSASFQNAQMTYGEAVAHVLSKYESALYLYPHESESTALGKFVMQFQETDWQFLRRLASMNNTFLLPDSAYDRSAFWVGLPNGRAVQEVSDVPHAIEKDFDRIREVLGNNLIPGAVAEDFIKIEICASHLFFRLGDRVSFKGREFVVSEKESVLSAETAIMEHVYTFVPVNGTRCETTYNEKLQGNSISGIVLDVRKDFTKLHLKIDEGQDVSRATWFVQPSYYTAGNESGWCSMPDLGDKLWLHFPSDREEDCYIMSSTGADIEQVVSLATVPERNPVSGAVSSVPATSRRRVHRNKYLSNRNQNVLINDGEILLSSAEAAYIRITEGGGIEITSPSDVTMEGHNITIGSSGEYDTSTVTLEAANVIEMVCEGSSLIVDSSGEIHFYADKICTSSPHNAEIEIPSEEEIAEMIAAVYELNLRKDFIRTLDGLGGEFPPDFRAELLNRFDNRSSDNEIEGLISDAREMILRCAFISDIDGLRVDFPEGYRDELISRFDNRASDAEIELLTNEADALRRFIRDIDWDVDDWHWHWFGFPDDHRDNLIARFLAGESADDLLDAHEHTVRYSIDRHERVMEHINDLRNVDWVTELYNDTLPSSVRTVFATSDLRIREILEIGTVDATLESTNISTSSTRFARAFREVGIPDHNGIVSHYSGDDSYGWRREGSPANAMRHVIWKAIMTHEFGENNAMRIGRAHEDRPLILARIGDPLSSPFDSINVADDAIDLLNNYIGIEIANRHSELSMWDITRETLTYYHEHGLFVLDYRDGNYFIQIQRIPLEVYQEAVAILETLDEHGFSETFPHLNLPDTRPAHLVD